MDSGGETPEMQVDLAPFNMNQTCSVVLPLLSENQTFLWVSINHIDLQLEGRAELEKAFDGFPYVTQQQTAVLARRCSLHPDQVKGWFMVQRLRYGISWDYEDILKVRRKFMSSQGKIREQEARQTQTTQNGVCQEVKGEKDNKKEQKRGVKKSVGKKVTASSKIGRMRGKNVRASERLERKKMQKQPMNKEGFEADTLVEVRGNIPKRHRRMPNKFEKGGGDDGIVERAMEVETRVTWKKRKGGKNIKTKSLTSEKRAIMQLAFLKSQYPNKTEYDHLVSAIRIPRQVLVQWFSDTRYYIKKGKPGWMTQEQHSRALYNIRYRQCLESLAKTQLSKESKRK